MKMSFHIPGKALQLYIIAAVGIMGLTVLQDKLEANVQESSFYFSESALFSSFWLLFIPLLIIQKSTFKQKYFLFWILVPAACHMLLYPLMVYVLSGIFFNHTFEVYQTFRFAISNYLWAGIVGYSILPITYLFRGSEKEKEIEPKTPTAIFIREANKLIAIDQSEIQYITANTPYVDIITEQRRFLHSSSLRDMQKVLGTNFIRVHKSSIVNIEFIQSLVSRQNGDYDLIMKDGCKIRASRNYVAALKAKLISG